MPSDWVVLDTGPLVSLVNARDADHDLCRAALDAIAGRLVSTEAVVTEACYLLRRYPGAPQACLQLLLDLRVPIAPLVSRHA